MNNPVPGEWVKAANGATGRLLEVVRLRRTKGALVAVIRFGSYDSCYALAGLVEAKAGGATPKAEGAEIPAGVWSCKWRIARWTRRMKGTKRVWFEAGKD